MAICHIPISIIQRSKGKSAVAAAAYRSGTKLTNEWDGKTHDFSRKRGVVHAEILLPPHAPPSFSDRSILWNSVEQIEKARNSQLAREIEAALPRELTSIYMQTDGRSKGQSESYNLNTQRLGRELMTPSELATMPGDKCILQLRGLPPFYSPKYDLKRHPNYKFTAEADKKRNAFDLDKLIRRRRRPGLDEVCEVFQVDEPIPLTEEDEDILNYDDVDDPDAF